MPSRAIPPICTANPTSVVLESPSVTLSRTALESIWDETYLKAGKQTQLTRRRKATMAEAQKPAEKKRKTSIAEFVNQVRAETSKVVWPTREETIRTAIFVFIFMVILSLFFFGVDSLFNFVVTFLLELA